MEMSDEYKAMSLLRKYIRSTEEGERVKVSLSMPLKLPVKRYDGTYRTKLVPDDIELRVFDAYFSKKEDLICVFDIANDERPNDFDEVKFVEISMNVLGDRLNPDDFRKLMAQIGEVTDGEITKADAFATPAEADNYDTIEEFGSWS